MKTATASSTWLWCAVVIRWSPCAAYYPTRGWGFALLPRASCMWMVAMEHCARLYNYMILKNDTWKIQNTRTAQAPGNMCIRHRNSIAFLVFLLWECVWHVRHVKRHSPYMTRERCVPVMKGYEIRKESIVRDLRHERSLGERPKKYSLFGILTMEISVIKDT